MSKFNFYGYLLWGGFGIWLCGSGLLILADKNLHVGWLSLFLVLVGMGTGMVFQPTLVALQAQTPKMQRAVVTSNRNFLRSSGGAVGLAVSSAILANVLSGSLPNHLSYVANSTFAAPDLSTFNLQDQDAIASAYASASRAVFIFCAPLNALCLALCVFVKDHGLIREEDSPGATTPAVEHDVEKSNAEKSNEASRRPSAESAIVSSKTRGITNEAQVIPAGEELDKKATGT